MFALRFQAGELALGSIGGWQSGAAAPAISFLLARRRSAKVGLALLRRDRLASAWWSRSPACVRSEISGWELVLFIHWRVAVRRGGAGDFFFTCSTAALAEVWGQLRRDRLASAW